MSRLLINALVAVQVATMIGLGVVWAVAGNWRLASAQACYCVATVVLFARL